MADEYTPNYNFFLPKPSDSMADVERNLTDTFTIISTQAEPTVIPNGGALPQVGTYEVGDRVCRMKAVADPDDYTSSFILAAKDPNWNWFWRPIQRVISPWITVPNAAYQDLAAWAPHATSPLQTAMDSKGRLLFRGAITYVPAGGIPQNITYTVLKDLPELVRPAYPQMFNAAMSPMSGSTGFIGFKAARILIGATGTVQVRAFNTLPTSLHVWFSQCKYPAATKKFDNA